MNIGVDVVVVDSSNNSLDEFIHAFESQLTIDEMGLIANSKYDKLSTFYEIWGCKESYIKAIGVGLALELDQLNFRNENDMIKLYLKGKRLDSWSFYMTYIDPCTIAVVCCGRNDSSIVNFHNVNTKLIGEPIPSNQANLFHQCQLNTLLP
ncbi:hypothetical protein RMCBS344292_18861 [Rhizopus microsporus]|nr:hypothetical protein RMCBS344292_18861 [Rhizopus microsporus]